jgi:TPR repeat protein
VRTTALFFTLSAAFLLVLNPLHAQQPNPPIASLKAAAEAGDGPSQDKLGDAYLNHGDFENAVTWYRRSAPQGILNSQYQLAHILIGWANSTRFSKPATSSMHVDEALPWFLKAASQGHSRARLELGQLFQEGTYVKKDWPEAYKWFCLAADGNPLDLSAQIGKTYRDGLILKMTRDQIDEGNRRSAQFRAAPDTPTIMPEPAYFQHLKLQGIAGTPGHPLAIINGRTLGPNESTTITVDSRPVTFHCQAITTNSATILIEGFPTPKELTLR